MSPEVQLTNTSVVIGLSKICLIEECGVGAQ